MYLRSHRIKSVLLAATVIQLIFVIGPARGESWKVEDLGVAINAVNYENSSGVLAAGPGGKGSMFYTSYYRSTGAELVGYDFRENRMLRKKLGSDGGYGIAVGEDGCIYAGGVGPGNLYRYDPVSDKLTTIDAKSFGVEYIWDIAVTQGGMVYCAAGYPKTNLVVFDPKSGDARDLGEMVPGEKYLRSLCADQQGRLWCGVGMNAHLVVYDPVNATQQEVLPSEYAKSSSVYDIAAIGKYVVASINFDGVMLVYDAATMKVVRTIPKPAGQKAWMVSAGGHDQIAYLWTLPNMDAYRCDLRDGSLTLLAERLGQVKVVEGDRWVHVIDDQSYMVYDLESKRIVTQQVLAAGGDGMEIFSLCNGDDGNVYGSTYINMHMFRCEAVTGKITDLGKVSRWAGQVDSLSLGADGRIYIGAYTDAVVLVYDPRLPWRPGLKADSNPREIGPVGKGQYRTKANCLGPDGNIYVGSIPSYRSAESGAFTICDPKTGKMDVHLDLVKGGAVEYLVADDKWVYGAGGGEFFVYEPATGKKVFRAERPVSALGRMKDGRVVGSSGSSLFVFDPRVGKITEDKPNLAGGFTAMATGPDGLIYAVNSKQVARIGADGTSIEILAEQGGKFAAVDGQGRVYFAQGPKLCRCSPP